MSTTDRAKTETRVTGFLSACREHGVKATHQRVEIGRELAFTEELPDAESVFKRVRERVPTVEVTEMKSVNTVYA